MKKVSKKELKNAFRKIYIEEFEDPNESFMDFLLDLLSKEKLMEIIKSDGKYYYTHFDKYK